MRQKKIIPPSQYSDIIQRTIRSIDALVYELESDILHHPTMRADHFDLAMDVVPLIKKLSEARRYAQGALDVN